MCDLRITCLSLSWRAHKIRISGATDRLPIGRSLPKNKHSLSDRRQSCTRSWRNYARARGRPRATTTSLLFGDIMFHINILFIEENELAWRTRPYQKYWPRSSQPSPGWPIHHWVRLQDAPQPILHTKIEIPGSVDWKGAVYCLFR